MMRRRGLNLIEVVISVILVGAGLIPLLEGISRQRAAVMFSRDMTTAFSLAQEYVDYLRTVQTNPAPCGDSAPTVYDWVNRILDKEVTARVPAGVYTVWSGFGGQTGPLNPVLLCENQCSPLVSYRPEVSYYLTTTLGFQRRVDFVWDSIVNLPPAPSPYSRRIAGVNALMVRITIIKAGVLDEIPAGGRSTAYQVVTYIGKTR